MPCQQNRPFQVYKWTKNNQSCLLCDEPAEGHVPLCAACEAELPWLAGHCSVCALPLPTLGLACGACLKRPPTYERVEAPWRYGFPVDALVTRFKHRQRWPLGRLLAVLLARHLQYAFDEGLPRPDCLLPVPLSAPRLRLRGFNQAAMLARWLQQELHLPLDERLVLRPRDTSPQQELDAAERRRNLRGAFALSLLSAAAGRHFAVVDDVLTTGATAEAIASLLRRNGAARVDVYCLARTPKPGG